jgi:hypothetical protein
MGQICSKGDDGMMWYVLNVKSENVRFPRTLESLGFEYYEADNEFFFDAEYFCDIEEKADCLVEMGIEFQFVVFPDYGMVSKIVYDRNGYLKYKKMMNSEV